MGKHKIDVAVEKRPLHPHRTLRAKYIGEESIPREDVAEITYRHLPSYDAPIGIFCGVLILLSPLIGFILAVSLGLGGSIYASASGVDSGFFIAAGVAIGVFVGGSIFCGAGLTNLIAYIMVRKEANRNEEEAMTRLSQEADQEIDSRIAAQYATEQSAKTIGLDQCPSNQVIRNPEQSAALGQLGLFAESTDSTQQAGEIRPSTDPQIDEQTPLLKTNSI